MAQTTPHLNGVEASLVLQNKEITMVKPSQLTPSHLLSLSTIDNDPNLDLICQTVYVYPSSDSDPNRNQLDPATVIQQGLSNALVHYYPLAGKLTKHEDGKLRVNCTGEGVPFCSATASCTLSSLNYLYNIHVDTAKLLVLDFESPEENSRHPLLFQVIRFACGGFTLSTSLSHSVCDGFGAVQFLKAVAELARGADEPSVKPVWERERLAVETTDKEFKVPPFNKTNIAISPYLPSTDLIHESFDVNIECIQRLKAKLEKENGNQNNNITTLEALGAYVWRSKFRALEMNLDGNTDFSLAIGIRNLMEPPLPEGYYGNAFIGSPVMLQGKELCEWPLAKVACLIKESKKNATRMEYVRDMLVFLEKMNKENKKIENCGSSTILTDWRHMGLEDADFGWGRAVNVVPVPWNMFGYVSLCIFLPPFGLDLAMNGGVRVLVCLPGPAMLKFKEEMANLGNGDGESIL